MVFNIRKGATLPILKMVAIKDNRNDYNKLISLLPNATITFSMRDSRTNIYKVVNKPGSIYLKTPTTSDGDKEYYIGYQFTADDTDTCGIYVGQFNITFINLDTTVYGAMIAPVGEDLFIKVGDTFVKSDIIYI